MNRLLTMAAAALSFAAFQAHAEAASPSLERACPRIAETLQDELQHSVHSVDKPGHVQASFVVAGARIGSIAVEGGPRAYRSAVQRALGAVRCDAAAGANASYTLNIQLRQAG